MSESDLKGGDWNEAIAQAQEHVEERGHAAEEAASRQKPKAQGPIIAAAVVVLVAVIGWNLRVLSQPPADIPVQEEVHLAWFISDAVEAIEDFQADEGRLPTVEEAGELLEDDIVYESRGEAYAITVEGDEGTTVTYDSSTPLSDWLNYQASGMNGSAP